MYVIGLAGNIGTGKTTVAQVLANCGAVIIDGDKVGHRLLQQDHQVVHELLARFGPEILDESGSISRKKLADAAFKTAEGTFWLNEIMKPRVKKAIEEEIEDYRRNGVKVVVVEAALMYKKNWKGIINELWVTTAPQEVIIKRLKTSRGYEKEDTMERLNRQMTPLEMLNQADVVIDTDCTMAELARCVGELWDELQFRIQHRPNTEEVSI